MKVSEVLEKAFALLGPNGELWQHGGSCGSNSCASIAIYKITGQVGCSNAEKLFMKANRIKASGQYSAIYKWNDAPGRTWPEVKAAFQKAIALARQEESLDAT